MTEPNELELVRALVEGRLPPAEAESVAARVAADPDLAAFRDEYAFVHDMTAALAPLGPATDLRFDQVVPPEARPVRPWRFPVRAAAAVLLAGAAALGGFHFLAPSVPGVVELSAIPLAAVGSQPAGQVALPELPSGLADYRPAASGRINWLSSLEEGRALARLAGRPLLVFSEYPGCPLCAEMDEKAFRDADVLERIGDVVPVKIDLTKVTKDEFAFYWRQYPYFAVQDVEGAELHRFPGMQTGASLTAGIEAGVGGSTPPSWESVARFGSAFERALDAEMNLRYGAAAGAYADLEGDGVPERIRSAAADGRVRIAAAAARALDEARSAPDVEEASALLRTAAEHFDGTPYAAEFTRVERVTRLAGRFPDLVETSR